jgi:hypothetical protein
MSTQKGKLAAATGKNANGSSSSTDSSVTRANNNDNSNNCSLSQPKSERFESLLEKRKAERQSSASLPSSKKSNSVSSGSGVIAKVKLSELKGKIAEVKIKEEKGTLTKTASGGFSTPQRVGYTRVEWTEYYIIEDNGDDTSSETVVGASIINLYGLKDEVLRYKTMDNGDLFYWPARMFYQNTINQILSSAEATAGGDFLKNLSGKPLILLSRLSKFVGDEKPLLDFDETLEFLKDHIEERVDPSSNSNVKKTFHFYVVRKPLDAAELDSFVAVTAKIGP